MDRVWGRAVSDRLSVFPEDERDVVAKGRVFLGLFLKAERRIFAYILTLLPHLADAEDVLQEVSLTMWEKFDEHDPPEDFTSWGFRIAYNRVLHYRRGRQRNRVIFSERMLEQVAETMADQAMSVRLDSRREALNDCIEKLAKRDRDLLAERFKEGATPHSTAQHIGRSVDAVYKALARIRKALIECVQRTLAREERP
jgi:RNA polymerase sigma-70 factor (ECF subfamily)